MATMPAGVGERAQDTVVTAGKQDTALPGRLGPLVARVRDLRAVTCAVPPAAEEMLLFPGEYRRIDVCGPGQHPAGAEGPQGIGKACCIDGGGGIRELTDHTVKSRQPHIGCLAPCARLTARPTQFRARCRRNAAPPERDGPAAGPCYPAPEGPGRCAGRFGRALAFGATCL